MGKRDRGGKVWWTDTERATALAVLDSNGGNVAKTAREVGIPEGTLYCWRLGYRWPEALQLRNEKGNKLALALEEIAWQLAAKIPEKIDKAPLNHLSTSFGIVVDKIHMLLTKPAPVPALPSGPIDVTRLTQDERDTLIVLLGRASGSADSVPTGSPASDPSGAPPELPKQLPAFLG